MRVLKMSVVARHSEGDKDQLRAVIKANPLKNCMRYCWKTECQSFYSHSAFEANWKCEKVCKWVPHELTANQKICHFEVSSLTLCNNKPLFNWIVMCNEKWILYNNQQQLASVAELRKSSKALLKDKLAPKIRHGNCLVGCCWSDPLPLSESHETITSEKYAQ